MVPDTGYIPQSGKRVCEKKQGDQTKDYRNLNKKSLKDLNFIIQAYAEI
jgi:hypothetical protein